MRTPSNFIFVSLICTSVLGARAEAAISFCNAILTGATPAVSVLLKNDDADFMRLGSKTLAPGGLEHLAAALASLAYYGPRPSADAGLVVEIFDIAFRNSIEVVTPTTTVRLGARVFKDKHSVKVRVEMPFAELTPADAAALAIADLLNHHELLRRPHALAREINILRAQLTILNDPGFTPLIEREFITGALASLNDVPKLIPLLGSESGFLGARFTGYQRARRTLVHAWLEINLLERRRLVEATWARLRPTASLDPEVLELATRGPRLLGRPWYVTIDRRVFDATALWFETILNRGTGPTVFLGVGPFEELPSARASVFNRPVNVAAYVAAFGIDPAAEWLGQLDSALVPKGGVDLTPTAFDNPADPFPSGGVDVAPIATGLPDPGGTDVGLPESLDTGPGGAGGAGPGL